MSQTSCAPLTDDPPKKMRVKSKVDCAEAVKRAFSEKRAEDDSAARILYNYLTNLDEKVPHEGWYFPGDKRGRDLSRFPIAADESLLAEFLDHRKWTIKNYRDWIKNFDFTEREVLIASGILRSLYIRDLAESFKDIPTRNISDDDRAKMIILSKALKLRSPYKLAFFNYWNKGVNQSYDRVAYRFKAREAKQIAQIKARPKKNDWTKEQTILAKDFYKFILSQEAGYWTTYRFPRSVSEEFSGDAALRARLDQYGWQPTNWTIWRDAMQLSPEDEIKFDEIMQILSHPDKKSRTLLRLQKGIKNQMRDGVEIRFPQSRAFYISKKVYKRGGPDEKWMSYETSLEQNLRANLGIGPRTYEYWRKSLDEPVRGAMDWFYLLHDSDRPKVIHVIKDLFIEVDRLVPLK